MEPVVKVQCRAKDVAHVTKVLPASQALYKKTMKEGCVHVVLDYHVHNLLVREDFAFHTRGLEATLRHIA